LLSKIGASRIEIVKKNNGYTMRAIRLVFLFIFALPLAGCLNESTVIKYNVTEVRCGTEELDEHNKCNKIIGIGADFEVLVNTVTQKVQITVIRSDGNWFEGSFLLEKCSVVNSENWKCVNEQHSKPDAPFKIDLISTFGMTHGHFYRSLTGGEPPHFYSSSVRSWRKLLFSWGFLDLREAEKLD
jgi:hypothetical protein